MSQWEKCHGGTNVRWDKCRWDKCWSDKCRSDKSRATQAPSERVELRLLLNSDDSFDTVAAAYCNHNYCYHLDNVITFTKSRLPLSKHIKNNPLIAGVLKLFYFANLLKYYPFSVTLKCYNLQWINGKRTILLDFGDPKKGRDPQFENHCLIVIKCN